MVIFTIIISLAALLTATVIIAGRRFKKAYEKDVSAGIGRTRRLEPPLITESDLAHLPGPVRRYLIYVGAVGKPKVYSMKAVFEAEMRSKDQDWFTLDVEQHNFFDQKERFFFLDAKVKGLPTRGYHKYAGGDASMCIKLLGLLPVVSADGDMMFTAETVTFFNDMCFLAPATLIDERIHWEEIDSSSVRATFTNLSTSIGAVLHFNREGQLINFVSDDRYDVNAEQRYRFSTPLSNFLKMNGFTLPTYGEAIWHYPEGPFVYGKYTLKQITYNLQ